MHNSAEEEWMLRRAYDSGRADERRRLYRIIMGALNLEGDVRKDAAGEELITL